jgi:hypothetical protein
MKWINGEARFALFASARAAATRSGDAPAITQAAITRHVTGMYYVNVSFWKNSNSIRDN